MWHFVSPNIVFGEGALDVLEELDGIRALVVTDATLVELGYVDRVASRLDRAGLEIHIFDQVEPEPSVETVLKGAQVARETEPDWIVGLGGGSPMDAAKAIWVVYERPDVEPAAINPFIHLGLREKARLVTIPTTSGTGSEATWAIVLTDTRDGRKMGLGNRENVADIAIVDPVMASGMPPRLTADTGMDALTHSIEGYTSTWHTDLTDGLCLKAASDIFRYLPRAVEDGSDMEARERMHNAATCAGLGFGNALASLAHAMGHALGAAFHVPHGRGVGVFLPYTVQFAAGEAAERFADLARLLDLTDEGGETAARELASRVFYLASEIGGPTDVASLGIDRSAFEESLEELVDQAFNDTQIVAAPRSPSYEELGRLFLHAFEGQEVWF